MLLRAAAMQTIRRRACDGLRVNDLLREIPLSRRILESRFVKYLGRTPHEEIERVRMDCVKRLLRETDLPLNAIARQTAFSSEYYLSVAFKRAIGQPPSEYRAGATAGLSSNARGQHGG